MVTAGSAPRVKGGQQIQVEINPELKGIDQSFRPKRSTRKKLRNGICSHKTGNHNSVSRSGGQIIIAHHYVITDFMTRCLPCSNSKHPWRWVRLMSVCCSPSKVELCRFCRKGSTLGQDVGCCRGEISLQSTFSFSIPSLPRHRTIS